MVKIMVLGTRCDFKAAIYEIGDLGDYFNFSYKHTMN